MSERILWIDNDKVFLQPLILRLTAEGYTVKQVFTLVEGVKEIENNNYDLLILDVMLPIREGEETLFPPKDTDLGRKAGLVFYNKYKRVLEEKGIVVFVFTIREDFAIRDEFLTAGLPAQNFMTKSEGGDAAIFLARIKELLRRRQTNESIKSIS